MRGWDDIVVSSNVVLGEAMGKTSVIMKAVGMEGTPKAHAIFSHSVCSKRPKHETMHQNMSHITQFGIRLVSNHPY